MYPNTDGNPDFMSQNRPSHSALRQKYYPDFNVEHNVDFKSCNLSSGQPIVLMSSFGSISQTQLYYIVIY